MPATTRSIAYLTRNCQPFGSIGRISSSGRPPRCSTDTRSTETSKRRGTSEAETPSSRQRRTMLSITACGAVEKVKTTCSTSCSSITRSRSQLAPSTGSVADAPSISSGSLSRKPDGAQAELGAVHQALRDQLADAAGADDQRRAAALAAGDRAGASDEEARAAERQGHGGQDPGLRGLRGRVRVVLEHHAQRDHRHRRDGGGRHDGADLVEQVRAQPLAVHAADAEHHEHQHAEEGDPRDRRRRLARAGATSPRSRRPRGRASAKSTRSGASLAAAGLPPVPQACPSWNRAAAPSLSAEPISLVNRSFVPMTTYNARSFKR